MHLYFDLVKADAPHTPTHVREGMKRHNIPNSYGQGHNEAPTHGDLDRHFGSTRYSDKKVKMTWGAGAHKEARQLHGGIVSAAHQNGEEAHPYHKHMANFHKEMTNAHRAKSSEAKTEHKAAAQTHLDAAHKVGTPDYANYASHSDVKEVKKALFIDLVKGLYDQARKKVATQRAIKQTEEAVSSASPEEKKPRFTMQHLAAAKEKFKQTHGVAADTTRKSFLDLIKGDAPVPMKPKKTKAAQGSELSAKERASAKRPGVLSAIGTALTRSETPEWFQKGLLITAAKQHRTNKSLPNWFAKAQR